MENKSCMKRKNFLIMSAAAICIVLGFILLSGKATEGNFEPEIFSFRRITFAPMLSLFGFVLMIFGILYKEKK